MALSIASRIPLAAALVVIVANEVKAPANQTDKATGDIQTQVEGIQDTGGRSVEEIGQITGIVGRISEFSNAIAAAVEQQGAATREIADSVRRAATGTRTVASNLAAATEASALVSGEADSLLESASALSAQAETPRREVHDFLKDIREN